MKAAVPFLLMYVLTTAPVSASTDAAEYWFNPSVSFGLNTATDLEIETAQRLRYAEDGRVDTYFGRLWLHRKIAPNATLSGAIERRVNDGGSDETRLIQQMTTGHGYLRTRLRLEQRFVDNADRVGLRVRPRLGVTVPIDADKRWKFKTDGELFFTLLNPRNGGDRGLTGLRTQTGFSYDISQRLSLSAAYLRQQDFDDSGPDAVGHAPIIGIEYSF